MVSNQFLFPLHFSVKFSADSPFAFLLCCADNCNSFFKNKLPSLSITGDIRYPPYPRLRPPALCPPALDAEDEDGAADDPVADQPTRDRARKYLDLSLSNVTVHMLYILPCVLAISRG